MDPRPFYFVGTSSAPFSQPFKKAFFVSTHNQPLIRQDDSPTQRPRYIEGLWVASSRLRHASPFARYPTYPCPTALHTLTLLFVQPTFLLPCHTHSPSLLSLVFASTFRKWFIVSHVTRRIKVLKATVDGAAHSCLS